MTEGDDAILFLYHKMDWLLEYLTSLDVKRVDEPLFTACARFREQHVLVGFKIHNAVWGAMTKAQDINADIAIKKTWFLVLLSLPCMQPVRDFVVSSSQAPARAVAFLAWLGPAVDAMNGGAYASFPKPLNEFVAASLRQYNL